MQSIPLFINVYPSTIVHPAFPDFLRKLKPIRSSRQHIVLEINEPEKISDIGLLKKAIRFLRTGGFSAALDDIGKVEFSLHTVTELEPDFMKLDRYYSAESSIFVKKNKTDSNVFKLLQAKKHLFSSKRNRRAKRFSNG